MTIGHGDLRKGLAIVLDGAPHIVVDYERSKMQQRAPVLRIRFRELRTGRVVDRTFQGYDVKLMPAAVHRRSVQYIYNEGDIYYFMDTETFEQSPLSVEQIGDALKFLTEQATVDIVFFEGQPFAVELPITVDLKVVEADPGVRGNTAQGGTKPVKLETGLIIQAPLFVEADETVRVDTRTGEYLARV